MKTETNNHMRWILFAFTLLIVCLVSACATTSTGGKSAANNKSEALTPDAKYIAEITRAPDSENVVLAKRFLHSFKAGEIVLWAMKNEMDKQGESQPGLTEVVRRAFDSVDADDFENLCARVYVRHLSRDELFVMANFAESNTGTRFFNQVLGQTLQGKQINSTEVMKEFNADELLEIMKFSTSKEFSSAQLKLAAVNSELGIEGRKFGEAVVREYVSKQ